MYAAKIYLCITKMYLLHFLCTFLVELFIFGGSIEDKSCNYGVGGRLPLNLHLFPPPPCAKNDVVYELLTNLPIAHRKNG